MEEYRNIEKSIIKKYRKDIWGKFVKAIKDYNMIEENDKIAVCISGGKDSFLLAKCMQELKRHGKFNFDIEFITMDPGYHKDNVKLINNNAELLNIPLTMFESNIFDVVSVHGKDDPCYLCARMRRGYLYSKAKELGCNKIALAHHFDDVIETIMLNMLYNGRYGSMMPKLHSDNFEGMELIRPMYYISEESIISWKNYNKLNFINCGCMITVCSSATKRAEMKKLIKYLKELNPNADKNIFTSSDNINLNTVLGYYKDKNYHSFLDEYLPKEDKK
jgi:tRNA(Ile)-lysidine synthase TilS/MesJ